MKNILLIIFFFCSILSFSQTQKDFKYIADDNDGANIYITTPENEGDYLKFWISHTIPVRPVKNAELKEIFFGGNRELLLVELKCSDKTYNLIKIITYNKKGEIEKSEDSIERQEKVYPGSFMNIVATEVCKL